MTLAFNDDALPGELFPLRPVRRSGIHHRMQKTVKPEDTNIVLDSTSGTYAGPRLGVDTHEQTPWPALEI